MKKPHILALLLLPLCTLASECVPPRNADGVIQRSPWQVRQFRKANPCPGTGLTTGRCPGHVVDHIVPLCACGPDRPSNMQWQTTAESKIKDRLERAQCRGRS